jgi:molybdate transport system ATP-binding protein
VRFVAGLASPRSGRITLDGKVLLDTERGIAVRPQERAFGLVFQDYVLFPHLTVWQNVAFGLRARRLPRAVQHERVAESLERVGMTGMERRHPAQLSGGQQQRVALARALALQPRLLLLDEPLSALDVQTRREVREQLRQILRTGGLTAIVVTHNYLDALLFGEHIVVMDDGRIVQQGPQADLLRHPRSSYVAELVGTNFFSGTVAERGGGSLPTIRLRPRHGAELELEASAHAGDGEALAPGTDAFVMVHPRSITLHRSRPEGSARNVLRGRIHHLLHGPDDAMGTVGHVRVSMETEPGVPLIAELTSRSAADMDLDEGDIVYATFKASEVVAYA